MLSKFYFRTIAHKSREKFEIVKLIIYTLKEKMVSIHPYNMTISKVVNKYLYIGVI